ncbi:MAG TPA: E3 binding domain-containing protein, partial [Gemmatimonadales bacterium]|nr:E3 binding domain-containing protein [Gemmatimonadales bacterium]
MPTKVVMEALSPTMEEGRLVEWKKQEGEAVAVGDVLAEVETDKAVMELVARVGGTLLRQSVPAGTTVPVSGEVAVIGEPGEAVGPPTTESGREPAERGAARRPAPPAAPPPAAAGDGGRAKASPLARKIAAERGIDLRTVQGSGPDGRVVARDLEGARAAGPSVAGAAAPTVRPSARPAVGGYTDVPLTQIRKTIARRLTQSIGPIPTFYLTTEVDMERV